MMVVDIQGMQKGNDFLLTDPAIHSTNTDKYGDGNLGEEGFSNFFKTHRYVSY